ncbi:MAG: STAS domain-containing protein [Calditrichaeota bacterium]|nr:STAS domain-containing protein [Calditrichota bacterium]
MEGIQLRTSQVGAAGTVTLLRVKGYVDATTAPDLHKAVTRLLQEEHYQIVVDLSAVNYISSAGWGVFVGEIRSIRESGGDLKIVHMTPEVREVFEMLEFNRILASYDSLEEAIDDFDVCAGYDLSKSARRQVVPSVDFDMQPAVRLQQPVASRATPATAQVAPVGIVEPASHARPAEAIDLPLTEKVRKIVLENPNNGAWGVMRALNSPRFGYTRMNYFKVRALLKRLNLDTKEKRYRFYRSR